MILHCAQHSHPPNPERAETRSCPRRPPLHRGGSASKKDAWLLALPIFPRLVLLPARWPELAPHREHLNGQAFLYFSPYGRASVVVPPRPSSEHILIVRAPGAVGHTDFLIYLSPSGGGGLVESPTARVQRGPSEAARCASTGGSPGHPPLY